MRKTVVTLVIFATLVALGPSIPGLHGFSALRTAQFASVLDFRPRSSTLPPEKSVATTRSPIEKPATLPLKNSPPPSVPFLFDQTGALTHFYQALARTEAKAPGAITRILHYGDSPVTADSITADARALFQQRFGDAGHGFVLIAKPWAWYGHRGVELRGRGWKIEPATQDRAHDLIHGLGGVSFRGEPGASSHIRLPDDQSTSAEVDFLYQPGGGTFTLSSEGRILGTTPTDGPEKKPGFAQFDLPPGTRDLDLNVTSGRVRVFGWNFEKKGPGVIYHSLGLNGGQVQMTLRYFDPKQWAIQLQHQRPDLVVINYGTNESVFPTYIEKQYPGELRKLIERVHGDLPGVSVLIMSPMDRGERDSSGDIVTVPILPRIVEIQQQTAAETGCAFFNTFQAMGGAGTMAKWYAAQPRLVSADFMHPLPAGAAKVGTLLEHSLVEDYDQFEAHQPHPSLASTAGKAH